MGYGRVLTTIAATVLLMTAASGSAAAQEITLRIEPPEERPEFEELANGGFALHGDAIPKSLVFDTFLIEASLMLRDPQGRPTYLRMLGMGDDEEAIAALAAAAAVADELRSRGFVDYSLEGDEYVEFQYRAQVARAEELGGLYVRLLHELEEIGYPIEKLEAHLEGPVRSGSSLWVTGPENRAAHLEQNEALRKAFDRGVEKEQQRRANEFAG